MISDELVSDIVAEIAENPELRDEIAGIVLDAITFNPKLKDRLLYHVMREVIEHEVKVGLVNPKEAENGERKQI